jgi:hypothetical protein
MGLDGRQGEGIKIADELGDIYYPLMRAEIKNDGAYEDGRNAGLAGVYKHITESEPDPLELVLLISAYTQAYDVFAGPPQFRHSVNMHDYHRAGLLGVYQWLK